VSSAGFSGMLWTPELRHAKSPADYLRRLQSMVLAPQMLLNIWSMPYPPWRQLDRDLNRAGTFYPAAEEEQLCAATRNILNQRMSFIPYLYAAFADYHFAGIPPFRAPVMDYPSSAALRELDWAWLAGENLLVAPLTAEENEKVLPLPPGRWYDFYTGAVSEGEVLLKPSADTLPIMVRENSLIPYAEPVEKIADGMKFKIQLRCYGPAPRPARLYADDGFSFAFEQNGEAYCGTVSADGTLSPNLSARYEVSEILNF